VIPKRLAEDSTIKCHASWAGKIRLATLQRIVAQGTSPRIAQQQLGHSDLRITLAVYSHVVGDSHRDAVEKLASVLGFLDPDGPTAEVKGTMIQ
jgi:integrase